MSKFSEETLSKCKDEDIRRLCKFLSIEGYDTLTIPQLIQELQFKDIVKSSGGWQGMYFRGVVK